MTALPSAHWLARGTQSAEAIRTLHTPEHPRRWYPWLIALAACDVVLTSIILGLGGTEINALACWVYREAGPMGLAGLKFACVVLVLAICQALARRRVSAARGVACFAVVANTVPVAVGVACLGVYAAHAGTLAG